MKDNTKEIRGLLEKAIVCTTDNAPLKEILSLLPPVCSVCGGSGEVDCQNCKGQKRLSVRDIETEENYLQVCCLCKGKGKTPCPACQAPAGEIEEFEIFPKLYNVAGQVVGAEIICGSLRIWKGSSSRSTKDVILIDNDLKEKFVQKLNQLIPNQACTHLTAQAKENKELKGESKKFEVGENLYREYYKSHTSEINQLKAKIEELEKDNESVADWMDEAHEAKEGNAVLVIKIEELKKDHTKEIFKLNDICVAKTRKLQAEIAEFEGEKEELRKFIIDWDGHVLTCNKGTQGSCDCGYQKAKDQALQGKQKEKE